MKILIELPPDKSFRKMMCKSYVNENKIVLFNLYTVNNKVLN